MKADSIMNELQELADEKKGKDLSRFFKTGKGKYGEGDIFLGITVPSQRKIAKQYCDIAFSEIQKLLDSPIHEFRLTGLFILVYKFDYLLKISKKDKNNTYGKGEWQ